MIEHEADIEVSKTHFHVVIKFKHPQSFDVIKNRFPYGDIESARSIKSSVQYLIHMNDKSKKQYPWDAIKTNCEDMTPFKVQSLQQQAVTIQRVLEDIEKGIIREYNQFDLIPIEIWALNKTKIVNGLTYYREKICMDKHRQIKVIFISGETGTGKTTMAKQYCDNAKKSYCVSSSSNDPMQDYKGEDVLILDDLRDDDFKYNDLLKVLDNHTKSSVRSRYNNKSFIGELIIITSHKPINNWYYDIEREKKEQLFRRVTELYKMYPDRMEIFQYNESTHKYMHVMTTKNIVLLKIREKVQMSLDFIKILGVEDADEIDKFKSEIDMMTDEQVAKLAEGIPQAEIIDDDDDNGFIESLFDKPKKKKW